MEKRKAESDISHGRGVRVRRPLKFALADAVDPSTNFYLEIRDLNLRSDELWASTWLLITGPWQSGKSTLMYRLAERVQEDGESIAIVTTLNQEMVQAANNVNCNDKQASDEFFQLLARSMVRASGQKLVYNGEPGWDGILEMLTVKKGHKEQVFWFIDEAAYLNEIQRPHILLTLLDGLRTCKQDSKSGGPGHYRLRSFVLVGTAKTRRLLRNSRIERVTLQGGSYVVSSHTEFDSYYPLDSSPISRLSIEVQRSLDYFDVADIAKLLNDYKTEHGVVFRGSFDEAQPVAERRQAKIIWKYASHIFSLTSGHKGMVGCSCGYLAIKREFAVLAEWKRRVRLGYLAAYLFYGRSYSRMTSNIPEYSEELRQIIFRGVMSGSPVPVTRDQVDMLLPAINDGVLVRRDLQVSVSSSLLLQAMLEDLRMVPRDALTPVHSFNEALKLAFSYINVNRLQQFEVFNANGQPSEYVWQSEVLLSTKFVLEYAFKASRYSVLVEAKKKKNRRLRLDFLFKNSDLRGCEVQGAGDEESIRKHVKKSDEKYRVLYGCEMHYVYLQFGDAPAGAVRDPKTVIARESAERQLVCWFVCYVPTEHVWNVERLVGSEWVSSRVPGASHYPEFMFGIRRDALYEIEDLVS